MLLEALLEDGFLSRVVHVIEAVTQGCFVDPEFLGGFGDAALGPDEGVRDLAYVREERPGCSFADRPFFAWVVAAPG